jgi:hypothetical protein
MGAERDHIRASRPSGSAMPKFINMDIKVGVTTTVQDDLQGNLELSEQTPSTWRGNMDKKGVHL